MKTQNSKPKGNNNMNTFRLYNKLSAKAIEDVQLSRIAGGADTADTPAYQHGDWVCFRALRCTNPNKTLTGKVLQGMVLMFRDGEYYIGYSGTIYLAFAEDILCAA